jgi:hypothetical protein
MNDKTMSYEEAIAWCVEWHATVSFIYEQSPRARVKASGFPFTEHYTFLEAVDAARKLVIEHERLRKISEEGGEGYQCVRESYR